MVFSLNTLDDTVDMWERKGHFTYILDLYQRHKLCIIKIALGRTQPGQMFTLRDKWDPRRAEQQQIQAPVAHALGHSHVGVNGGGNALLKLSSRVLSLSVGEGTHLCF